MTKGRPPFIWDSSIGREEERAVARVMKSKVLSDFYGSPGPRFLGGVEVQALDSEWARFFKVPHAVSMNSATSGLFAAIQSLQLKPGDEVLVPTFTMSATAAAVAAVGAVPVFTDVEPDTFCLCPRAAARAITQKTRAIFAVNLFGQPADLTALGKLARAHKLWLIEDNAQAPGALHKGVYAGTVGDIGVFSLNCHKAIQCGEGGVAVTRDEKLATRLQLIRNHGENVLGSRVPRNLRGFLGQNYRLTELQAAVAREQLKKLPAITRRRQERAARLRHTLARFGFLRAPKVRADCTHVYYLFPLLYRPDELGVSRDQFISALNTFGYSASRYVAPLYTLGAFKGRSKGSATSCPVSEELWRKTLFYPNLIRYRIGLLEIDTFADVVRKIVKKHGGA
ncbi:MAG: DegT/DnrJ/EryC1/StrS family aminotransferase [Planctomycetota bacterium]